MPPTVLNALHVYTVSAYNNYKGGGCTHRRGHFGTEILGNFPKATWLVTGGVRNLTQVV